jgi:hypothetical protein
MTTWVKISNIDEDVVVSWAKENCPSFCSWLIYDHSKLLLDDDEIACCYEFEFYNEQDAVLFVLTWSS